MSASPATRDLTDKQTAWVASFVASGGNAALAAREAGYAESSYRSVLANNLRNPLIQKAIYSATVDQLSTHAPAAVETLYRLMNASKSDKVKLDAAIAILDRAGFKPIERHQVAVKGDLRVTIDLG